VDFKAKAEIPEVFQERAKWNRIGPERGESCHLSDFGLHHARFREFVRARRRDGELPRLPEASSPNEPAKEQCFERTEGTRCSEN
jgi:hypothetical protein